MHPHADDDFASVANQSTKLADDEITSQLTTPNGSETVAHVKRKSRRSRWKKVRRDLMKTGTRLGQKMKELLEDEFNTKFDEKSKEASNLTWGDRVTYYFENRIAVGARYHGR